MNYPYKLPQLNFSFDALEPHIDAQTMEIHYSKHHQTYIDKLNSALEKYPDLHEKDLSDLLTNLVNLPEAIKSAVKNNGGGHLNHTFFWNCLTTPKTDNTPIGKLSTDINIKFGSFDNFKEQFSQAALNRFGSGWAWLVTDGNELEIMSTANQDNPISENKKPLIGLDVWEHAYYLKYQNRKAEYIQNFWNIIDWNKAEANLG